eukprot:2539784-Rhodomonas_salina.3
MLHILCVKPQAYTLNPIQPHSETPLVHTQPDGLAGCHTRPTSPELHHVAQFGLLAAAPARRQTEELTGEGSTVLASCSLRSESAHLSPV